MSNLIGIVVGLLTSFFKGDGWTKNLAAGNGLLFYGALAYSAYWLLGDSGASWHITLNARELSGVVLAGSALLEYFRRMPPPNV